MTRRRWYLLMNGLVGAVARGRGVVVVAHRALEPAPGSWSTCCCSARVSTAILIWSQHFADTLLRRAAPGGRAFLGARLAGHTLGALGVVAGIVTGWWPLVLAGGILVGAVAIAHSVSLGVQMRGGLPARFAPLVRYYVAAGLSLAVGVTLGVIMARAVASGERARPAVPRPHRLQPARLGRSHRGGHLHPALADGAAHPRHPTARTARRGAPSCSSAAGCCCTGCSA